MKNSTRFSVYLGYFKAPVVRLALIITGFTLASITRVLLGYSPIPISWQFMLGFCITYLLIGAALHYKKGY